MQINHQPPKHITVYGIAGTGKSHFASTMPTPQLIVMFDPIGKETPYTDGTFVDTYEDIEENKHPTLVNLFGTFKTIPTWDCFADAECTQLIRRIIWFHDRDHTNSQLRESAYDAYSIFQPTIERVLKKLEVKTFILDSITMLSTALMNKFAAEGTRNEKGQRIEESPRGWANRATDELEDVNQFINDLKINTVTICHSFYDTNPNRNPEWPQVSVHAYGRMRERFLITSGDVYRTFFQNGEYKLSVSADNAHVGNNSMKLNGIFPNNWEEILKADKTKVTFVKRER